ncbi:helix-turn-helix domain-containing protein [Pseudaquabacterium rugosum]|uniref:Helix-turn-helix domain-containing protein n=1 Tax=Pseudaquabacterium rugosum TaxID=2984194 RepID=A0ABU9BJ22_9BURK
MRCHIREAADADEHAQALTDWQQRYDQLSAGRFHGRVTELQLPQMQVFVEHTSHAVRQSCRVWDDAFWFGLAAQPTQAAARINGRINLAQGVMTRPGGSPFELVTPDAHTIYGVVVRRPWLQAAAAAQGCEVDWQRLQAAEVLPLAEGVRAAWLQILEPLLLGEAPLAWHRDSAGQLQELLLCPLLGVLDGAEVERGARDSLERRRRVVTQAQALVLADPGHPPDVPALCAQLHVSRRTLQYCFEDVLGLSPLQALRALRLNEVRRGLRAAAATGQGVHDVAAHWGFGHFSQFAADYRRLFGESPSRTLRQG